MSAQIKNAEGHLPETHREDLADLSLAHDELETALDRLVSRLNVAVSAIRKLAAAADTAFDAVRLIIEDESFRRLEPHVADNLRRFSARSAGSERTALAARIDERVAIVHSEIENQQRDQNTCLEQLRLYVMHADDLLRRAARSSLIPERVLIYGGERILKVKRRLGDVAQDVIRNQLAVWLDEQVVLARVSARVPRTDRRSFRSSTRSAASRYSRPPCGRSLSRRAMPRTCGWPSNGRRWMPPTTKRAS